MPGHDENEYHGVGEPKKTLTSTRTLQHSSSRAPAHAQGNFGPSDFPDNIEEEIVEVLSKSQMSISQMVEDARKYEAEMVEKAISIVEGENPSSGKNKFASMSIQDLSAELGLENVERGLTSAKVVEIRQRMGQNVISGEKSPSALRVFLGEFSSLVVLLLVGAAIASLALKQWVEGVAILIIVTLNAALATFMQKSASDALKKLANMAAPRCNVRRDGAELTVDSIDIVPGDVVLLRTGDSVAADLRIMEVVELKANEALLTGESEDVSKTLVAKDMDAPFATNLCFASTSITNGTGVGIVVTTGMNTQVGRIAAQLQKAGRGSRLTPLQRGLNRLGGLIGILAIFVLIIVVVIAVVTDYRDPAHPDADPVLTIILVAVGFAVSSIPEGLPMVVTISLSLGARDMVKRKANVRKLPAVETLGCCSVICSDKTGTLTEGKMTAVKLVTVCRNASLSDSGGLCKSFSFWPTKGFDPNGGIFDSQKLDDTSKDNMMHLYNDGEFQSFDKVLCDYGNPSSEAAASGRVRSLVLAAYLNSYGTKLLKDVETKRWITAGNMSEGALVVAAAKARYGESVNVHDRTMEEYARIKDLEVPFNSSRKMMATIHKLPTVNAFGKVDLSGTDKEFHHVAVVKGAPDRVFKHVQFAMTESGNDSKIDLSTPMTKEDHDELDRVNLCLSEGALRVLALTIRPLSDNDIEVLKNCGDADERLSYILGDGNRSLTVLGVVGSLDPPRPGVRDAIATCRDAGVRVIMITGDQKPTACAIGREIGLLHPDDNPTEVSIECSHLHVDNDASMDHLPDEEIDTITNRVNVFSRAQPEDKITIVESLRRQGHTVAMTGDGVNDAPALKAADIGVAMGITGTDVAKGASEMVLLDDNFCTIVAAIDEGRKIYANIQKFVCFLLGTNIGEIIYLTVAIASSLPLPLEALQILFLNLMSDGCPAIALSKEPADGDNMKKKPRAKNQQIMTRDWWLFGNLPHTIIEAMCVLAVLCIGLYLSTGVMQLQDLKDQCRYAQVKKDGTSETIGYRYFCRTFEYRVRSNYVGWVTNIDFWDPETGKTQQFLGAAAGKHENLSFDSEELDPIIRRKMQNGCPAETAVDIAGGWCMPLASASVVDKNQTPAGAAPSDYYDSSARGSRMGRTMSFITAVWCEMLRAYTVRSWEWFFTVFNRNPFMHLACSTSATLTCLLTLIPGIQEVFSTMALAWWQYLFAISWGFLNLILDEIIPKPLYRYYRTKRQSKISPTDPTVALK